MDKNTSKPKMHISIIIHYILQLILTCWDIILSAFWSAE